MAIDPVRLARIRARLLAAATVAVPACGGGTPDHVNTRPPDDVHVNEAPPDTDKKPFNGPINEHPVDEPRVSPKPDDVIVNRPNPDTSNPVSPKDIPPPGQTINTAPDTPPDPIHVNRPAPSSNVPAPKKPKDNVNTPEPGPNGK